MASDFCRSVNANGTQNATSRAGNANVGAITPMHAVLLAADAHVAADDAGIRAVVAAPQGVAQHQHALVPEHGSSSRNMSAQARAHTEGAEQGRRRHHTDHALRRVLIGEIEAVAVVQRAVGQRRRLFAPVEIVRHGIGGFLFALRRIRVVDAHQLIRCG
jgi:hypothetical protein